METSLLSAPSQPAPPPPRRRRSVSRALSGLLLAVVTLAAVGAAAAVVFCNLSIASVLSPSMEPAFGAGDAVVTRALATTRVKRGDVVVLPLPGSPGQRYVHRVFTVSSEGGATTVRTKGDANAAPDTWTLQVTSAQVPLVVAHVDEVGRMGLWLNHPPIRIGLILSVMVFTLVGVKRGLLS